MICFLAESFDDLWLADGSGRPNVGAMHEWTHGRRANDTSPRPMPHLIVMTPAGIFCIDCPASEGLPGRYWQRSGEPPFLTLSPSILINPNPKNAPSWHGYLRNGELLAA